MKDKEKFAEGEKIARTGSFHGALSTEDRLVLVLVLILVLLLYCRSLSLLLLMLLSLPLAFMHIARA